VVLFLELESCWFVLTKLNIPVKHKPCGFICPGYVLITRVVVLLTLDSELRLPHDLQISTANVIWQNRNKI
jgi:hypothetical protein